MIKATLGLMTEPFYRSELSLMPHQKEIFDMIQIHAQHGGFSVVVGEPGTGKTTLKEHIEALNSPQARVISCSRTLHSYINVLRQLAHSFEITYKDRTLEQDLIKSAFEQHRAGKRLYVLIDEAHLLDLPVLRRLRLLLDRFPRSNNLLLLGQPSLMLNLTLSAFEDLKSRITFSRRLLALSPEQMQDYIHGELHAVKLPESTFDDAALQVIVRHAEGKLRLARNLCHGSLLQACLTGERSVSITHVNEVLIQPHWRSHQNLLHQQTQELEQAQHSNQPRVHTKSR